MTKYAVEVTDTALAALSDQAQFIAVERQEPVNAQRWLEQVWDAADSLERWPFRAPLAEENAYVSYTVRQLIVGGHLLLFTVDDDRHVVSIVGLRHGHRRPRPADLPKDTEPPD